MRWVWLVAVAVTLMTGQGWAAQDVANTPHNLSSSGQFEIKSATIDEICVFCHTPHNALPQTPLWNRDLPGSIYNEYQSTTMQATPGQPTGSSLLCLSCHDGTVAMGSLRNPPNNVTNDLLTTFLLGRRSDLGTDLTNDHPVSFAYDTGVQSADGKLAHPSSIGLPLEPGNLLQCSSCHDAHEADIIPFLRKTTLNGELCTTCHLQNGASWSWASSAHATSTASDPSGTAWQERKAEWRGANVAQNACFNCHTPHAASQAERLIKAEEENACYLCHGSGVAATDIQAEMQKSSRHRVGSYSSIHDPAESFVPTGPTKHVECADCHNPHATSDATASAPLVTGALAGLPGVSSSGGALPEATNQFETCYRCHADNNMLTGPTVTRGINETNVRLDFSLSNPSYHPVEAAGVNKNVPSLKAPWTVNSVLYCTDCHSNNEGPGAGGAGPAGPHGSMFSPLLERNYTTADNTTESAQAYAMCYKCHDQTSILADESFGEHREHIVGQRAPCSACHDAHGVSSAGGGNATNNSNLINFDSTIVFANAANVGPLFEDTGLFQGRCYLSCHGENHNPCAYGGAPGGGC